MPEKSKPQMILIAGSNGSGKSTLTNQLMSEGSVTCLTAFLKPLCTLVDPTLSSYA